MATNAHPWYQQSRDEVLSPDIHNQAKVAVSPVIEFNTDAICVFVRRH